MTKEVRYLLYGAGLLGGIGALVYGLFKTKWVSDAKTQDAMPREVAWGGSQRVAERVLKHAAALSVPVTSRKRDDTMTLLVGSTKGSDHHIGNLSAYAIDLGVTGERGDRLFDAIRREYGIPTQAGTYTRYNVVDNGQVFSVQLLWRVDGHFNHVHVGVRRVDAVALAGLRYGGGQRR